MSLINSAEIEYEPFNIHAAMDYVKHYQEVALENGFDVGKGYIKVTSYRPEEKTMASFPAYYLLNKPPPFGDKEPNPQAVYETFAPLFTPPPNWRAGSDTCRDKEIIFNPSWLSPTWLYYESPIWMEVAAHEVGHFTQKCIQYDDISKEWTADIIGLELLASSNRAESRLALLYGLKENLIGAIIVEISKAGGNPEYFLNTLDLTENEMEQYMIEVERCRNSLEFCTKRSDGYFMGVVDRVINAEGTIIEDAANPQGYIEIDNLKPLLDEWLK